jgi:hypothetical protein
MGGITRMRPESDTGRLLVVVARVARVRLGRYRGNGLPPPSANAVATVTRIVAIATVVAKISDRRV